MQVKKTFLERLENPGGKGTDSGAVATLGQRGKIVRAVLWIGFESAAADPNKGAPLASAPVLPAFPLPALSEFFGRFAGCDYDGIPNR